MELHFGKKTMDIGTSAFSFVRTLMVAGTGGAEINECLLVVERIRQNDEESWIREWASIAENVYRIADRAARAGQTVTARQAYLRASNYYRAAMFSLPNTDARLNSYLTSSRECFHKAAKLFRRKSRLWIFHSAVLACRDILCPSPINPNTLHCSSSMAAIPPTRRWFIGSDSRRWHAAGTA